LSTAAHYLMFQWFMQPEGMLPLVLFNHDKATICLTTVFDHSLAHPVP